MLILEAVHLWISEPSLLFKEMVRLELFSTRYQAVNLALDLAGIETVWDMPPCVVAVPILAE
jgi:hypothetical protein